MSRALNQLMLSPRALGRGCLVAAFIALMQATAMFGVTNVMSSLLAPEGELASSGIQFLGKIMLIGLGVSGAIVGWIVGAQANPFDGGDRGFIAQLPASPVDLHRARLRAGLITLLLPLVLSFGILVAAAWMRDIAPEVGTVAFEVIAGLLLAIAIYELPIVPRYSGRFRKGAVLVAALLPAVFLLFVGSIMLTATAAVIAVGLLFISWNKQAKPTFAAPIQLAKAIGVAKRKHVKSGRKILRKWILRHTLLDWRLLLILPFLLIFPLKGTGTIDHTSLNDHFLLFYIFGAFVASLAMVTRKLEFLPISRKQMLPYIVLPILLPTMIGTVASECVNVGWIPSFLDPVDKLEQPIRYSSDRSLSSDQIVQRLIVPAQLLEVTSANDFVAIDGFPGELFSATVLPIPGTGYGFYSPFDVPEYESGQANPVTISFQLERALTALYGASLPVKELQERFFSTYKNTCYFKAEEFEEWQAVWASSHQEKFTSQENYWQGQVIHLMPARAIGWIAGFGMVLVLAFSLRMRFTSRKSALMRIGAIWIPGGGLLFLLTNPFNSFSGLILTDGFNSRSSMLPSQLVRSILPDNLPLAWLSVVAFFCLTTFLVYRIYFHTEWLLNPKMGGAAKRQQDKWQKI